MVHVRQGGARVSNGGIDDIMGYMCPNDGDSLIKRRNARIARDVS